MNALAHLRCDFSNKEVRDMAVPALESVFKKVYTCRFERGPQDPSISCK